MLFNSFTFALFFPIVFVCYWVFCKNSVKKQNILLLIASYFFYAFWDLRFLSLLLFSTALDYFFGIKIAKSNSKKLFLFVSIFINLGFLAFFKYYNFFIVEFAQMLRAVGFSSSFNTLSIILPIGISFYTFHGLSYVIDIYYDRIKPTKNWVNYSLFVSFFPLLVAGPIERATHLLPQINQKRIFNYSNAVNGLRQILWGLFKKLVIADNCAIYANEIFNHYELQSGSSLMLGSVMFAFQIYGDFSGYSDIALGCARLLGIELLQNFKFPYFSKNISEFWRRWHISLSSWFRDYVFIPLGGSKKGMFFTVVNVLIVFAISGFWHGANFTFLIWGLIHGTLVSLHLFYNHYFKMGIVNTTISTVQLIIKGFQVLLTFLVVVLAWVFFRASSLHQAKLITTKIFSISSFSIPSELPFITIGLILFFLSIEFTGRKNKFAIEYLIIYENPFFKYLFYYALIMMIVVFALQEPQQFIYFQF